MKHDETKKLIIERDLLNAEASALLQSLPGTDGTLASISLKQQGLYPEGTYIENRATGEPIYLPFKDPNTFRADEGLQPGTLPWAVSGIGGPVCTTTDLGGPQWSLLDSDNNLPGANVQLPGCRRKWVDVKRQTQVRRFVKNSFPSLDPDALYNDFDGNPDWLPVVNAPQYDFPDKVYFFNESSPALPTLPGGSHSSEDPSCYWEGTTPASRPDCFRGGQPLASLRAGAINRALGADSPGLSNLTDLVVPYASEMAALSDNYTRMLVAFSAEFLEGLRTVGDLADPYGVGISGGSDPDHTFDYNENGEIYNKYIPPYEPGEHENLTEARENAQDAEDRAQGNIWHRRRYIAELLFAYCGADYGLGDCKIEDRYNVYDQAETQVELPGIEQLRTLYTNDPRAKCFKAESDPTVCEDVQPDNAYYASLPQGIVADPTSDLYPADADLRQLYLDTLQFITTRTDCNPNDKEQEGCVWARDKDERDQWEFLEGDDAYLITNKHCGLLEPQYCGLIQSMFNIAGVKRNTLRAGGNGTYGRRTFQWHSGGEVLVRYDRRNVLGFSTDFTEDRTKTNFGVEATWIGGVPNMDSDAWNNTTDTDDFNLTISVDRPTFINFLNANRTFFFNSQWFFQYRRGYRSSFPGNGPWNVLATFTAMTGYFQDRLNPAFTFVHDFQSSSGAFLPSLSYRFDEKFSATIGLLMFYGRPQWVDMPLNEIGPAGNRSGSRAYYDTVENGLSLVRDRDEVFLRLRYTF
jgi:hypothetical protein